MSVGLKKLGLVKTFALLSLITFLITGIILSYIVSRHIEKDAISNKLKITQFAIKTITDDKKTSLSSLQNELINLNLSDYYIWDKKGTLLLSSFSHSKNIQSNTRYIESNFPEINKALPKYEVYRKNSLLVKFSIDNKKDELQYYVIITFPFEEIKNHVAMLNKSISVTLTGGLLLLYFLLLEIIIKASKRLVKQKEDVELKNDELVEVYKKLNNSFNSTIQVISDAIDARDSYTAGHSDRVMNYSVAIGKKLNMNDESIEHLRLAALLHDIGKIGISDEVLLKPGKLTDEEYTIIKKHPQIAVNILKSVDAFNILLPSILHHHERYDGKGYPQNISAEDIPLNARIISIADTFDAMTSNRPYRKALSFDKAIHEIESNKDKQFDPYIASVFIEIIKKENF